MPRALFLALSLALLAPVPSPAQGGLQVAELGECPLESGAVIQNCRVAYRTFGRLDSARSNAVLFTTQFTGTSAQIAGYVGADGLVDTTKHFVIAVDAFGNGVSSSPSNSTAQPGAGFPRIAIRDMVAAQYRLVTEVLGLPSLHAVMGISMGGMQAFEWAVSHPGFAAKVIPIAGSPRLAAYDIVLWETALRILATYEESGSVAASAALFGLSFLVGNSPDYHARTTPRDSLPGILGRLDGMPLPVPIARNLATQIHAMIDHNVAAPHDDSLERAAARVRADLLVIVTVRDHVVTPGPALEFAELLGAEPLVLTSDCGHNGLRCDAEQLEQAVQRFLAGPN
ncbi:MAG: alpha/beta fold hydrolase [Gemmatimonadota bacterium]|nr:MAG: alpha/beta fold hydrolase [Gemmatimonadota bacterium]